MKASAASLILQSAVALAALGDAGNASAQTTSCSLTDYDCVEHEYPQVCFDSPSKLRLDACLTWLREIERSPSLDIRSSAAAIYSLIAPNPAAEAVRPQLQARSQELILDILAENPWHPGALLGFAGLAESEEERVRRLRDAVTADPTPMKLGFLAGAVRDMNGGMLEAAFLNERAYELAMTGQGGNYALRYARDAIWEYEWAGSPERAMQLRDRVAQDRNIAAMLRESATADALGPARLDRILQDLCSEMMLNVLGGKPCLDSIDNVILAAEHAQATGASHLKQALESAMLVAAQSGSRLDAVDSSWRKRFPAALERLVGADSSDRLQRVEEIITVE